MEQIWETILKFLTEMGFVKLFSDADVAWWKYLIMIAVACLLLYLAIVKKFEDVALELMHRAIAEFE